MSRMKKCMLSIIIVCDASQLSMSRKPSKLMVFDNPDKSNHERWSDKRALAAIPHPFRGIACGPPNSGKTSLICNLIAWSDPPFDRVIVSSVDPEAREWQRLCDDVEVHDASTYGPVPDFRDLDPDQKTLIVLEDLPLTGLRGESAELLDRLYGHGSTHRNTSVIATSQDLYRLPLCCRRNANLFFLWRQPDISSLKTIAERVGLRKADMIDLFDLCVKKTDSICLDMSDSSPAPIRLNLTRPITIESD